MIEITLSDGKIIEAHEPTAGMLRRAINDSKLEGDRLFSILRDCTGMSFDELDNIKIQDVEKIAEAIGVNKYNNTPSEQ